MSLKKLLCIQFLMIFFIASSMGATLEDAVEIGLKNSHLIKEASHVSDIQKYLKNKTISPFLPGIYTYYDYSHMDKKPREKTKKSSSAGFRISWNIFNGFSDYNAYKAASKSYSARLFEEQSFIQDIRVSIIRAYIDVLSSEKSLGVAEQAVTLLESQLKTANISFKAGVVPKSDVLKVDAESVAAKRQWLEAKSKFKIAVAVLENITGIDFPNNEKFQELSGQIQKPPGYEELEAIMLKNRSELKYLDKLLESKYYAENAVKGSWLPSMDLSLGWSKYGDSENLSGRKYGHDEDIVVQAMFKWILFDGALRRNNYKIAKSETAGLREKKFETEQKIKTRLITSLEEHLLAFESLGVAQSEVISALENYRVTNAMLKASSVTTTDFLDARVILSRAENSKNEAYYNIYRAMAEIERIIEYRYFSAGLGGI